MNYQNKNRDKASQMKTIYITLALSFALMFVLVLLSGAWRRSVDEGASPATTDVIATEPDRLVIATHTESESTTVIETEAAATTMVTASEETTAAESVMAEEVLPEFVSPVAGYLMKGHSGDTPVFSITMNDYRPHTGVDLYASAGDDVFAAASGVVTDIWEDPMSGNCISITHDGGAVSIYRNLDPTVPENIEAGVEVSCGEVIGSIGDTSLLEISDESHLHFELEIDGVAVDPAMYISFPTEDTEYEG